MKAPNYNYDDSAELINNIQSTIKSMSLTCKNAEQGMLRQYLDDHHFYLKSIPRVFILLS